jgi:RND family efflux transporter MFP subunit
MKIWWMFVLPFIAACGEKSPPPDVAQAGPKLVRALKVGAGGTALEQRYSGEVRARHETTLGFRVGGKIVERLVDAGARVRAGQPLARLDPGDARLTAVQAEANRSLAAAELKRTQELKAKNFISQAALDAKDTAARAAEAQARLAQNQAAYTTLVADAAGVVAVVLAEPGQVVAAGQGVLRVARDGAREVAFNIPESRIAGLKVGAGGTAELWSGAQGKTYKGVLRELAPMADPATRTFAARLALADADEAVALGMTATVRFATAGDGKTEKIVVPLAAILQQGDKAAVWIIGQDGTVSQRAIEIERYSDAGAVLKSGLSAGEQIVAAGAFKLAAGEKVRIAAEPTK